MDGGVDDGIDDECGSELRDIGLSEVPLTPDVLVVLDRSGSMNEELEGGGHKWTVMRDALGDALTRTDDRVRYGFIPFPAGDYCDDALSVEVPMSPGASSEIVRWMSVNEPMGETPTYQALALARETFAATPPNPDGRYVLLATDGAPVCGGFYSDGEVTGGDTIEGAKDKTRAEVEKLADAGVSTIVLGYDSHSVCGPGSFRPICRTNPDLIDPRPLLEDMAVLGGTAREDGPPSFYEADDAGSLETALETITRFITPPSCTYELAETPPDPERVTVLLDDEALPRDMRHEDGWDYHPDAGSITFFGSACDRVKAGDVGELRFAFGCPGPVLF